MPNFECQTVSVAEDTPAGPITTETEVPARSTQWLAAIRYSPASAILTACSSVLGPMFLSPICLLLPAIIRSRVRPPRRAGSVGATQPRHLYYTTPLDGVNAKSDEYFLLASGGVMM